MTLDDLIRKMLEMFPDTIVQEDADGQVCVCTGMVADREGNLTPMPDAP